MRACPPPSARRNQEISEWELVLEAAATSLGLDSARCDLLARGNHDSEKRNAITCSREKKGAPVGKHDPLLTCQPRNGNESKAFVIGPPGRSRTNIARGVSRPLDVDATKKHGGTLGQRRGHWRIATRRGRAADWQRLEQIPLESLVDPQPGPLREGGVIERKR